MKKGGFLRNVLDTIRSNQANQAGGAGGNNSGLNNRNTEFAGQLKAQHFSLCQVARHGFPEQPTALAFDPVQKIAAIGTKSGVLHVFGRPGVDVWAQHKPEYAITHIRFIINQGAIITVTSDESIHLWSLRGPNLKLQLSTSSATSSSPAQPSHSPASSSNLSSISPQSAASGPGSASTTIGGSTSIFHGQSNADSGAQPGDPDYLSDQLSPSPTGGAHGVGSTGGAEIYSRRPEILHTLKFQREHITCLHQTLMSKWLYIGTERGNVHVANVETFELSGYSIAWNKAIELSRKTHPGAIIHISECPQDTNKLLIGYESGCIALWDLKSKNAEGRYYHAENLLWLAWHYEGKQFVAAHGDGSLVTWQIRSNARPVQILHPHAKTGPSLPTQQSQDYDYSQQQQTTSALTSSFARALNNELYRPINKVEWKTSKTSNEQFLLFSGGLPYDGLEQQHHQLLLEPATSVSRQSTGPSPIQITQGNTTRLSAAQAQTQQQQRNTLSASPSGGSNFPSPSPVSPSISPISSASRQSSSQQQQQQQQQLLQQQQRAKILRSTSLTVMYGKSITVLEMDETIIDFITICDNSPYENDTSDPYAVIVLLANDLILIDLTSSGYPSFDSPYPAASLNESPVTCVHYLADCASDLIPFLYSTSQNVVSRAPKKGFSDKEWPINGGEWGQPMQSYPELVITGHADGTIKFWDMSGVNFDLISKIKTTKLFERPNKLANSKIVPANFQQPPSYQTEYSMQNSERQQQEQDYFAIEKIEFCPKTKHLLVAGALAQVIKFKLNKSSPPSPSAGEISTILVDPPKSETLVQQQKARQHLLLKARSNQSSAGVVGVAQSGGGSSSSSGSQRGRGQTGFQAELICLTPLLVFPNNNSASSPEEEKTSFYCRAPPKVTALALQTAHNILVYAHEAGIVLVDVIQKCVIMSATLSDLYGGASIMTNNRDISIQPFATSSILQHHYQSSGVGGVASSLPLSGHPTNTADFGGRSNHALGSINNSSNADNNGGGAQSKLTRTTGDGGNEFQDNDANDNGALAASLHKSGAAINGPSAAGGASSQPSAAAAAAATATVTTTTANQSRFTTNSMFQRQLSTTALNSSNSTQPSASNAAAAAAASSTSGGNSSSSTLRGHSASSAGSGGPRGLFQRQMTASQLFSSSSAAAAAAAAAASTQRSGAWEVESTTTTMSNNKQRAAALLATTRAGGDLSGASSALCLSSQPGSGGGGGIASLSSARSARRLANTDHPNSGADHHSSEQQASKKPGKNKRIISRMLSISAIQTSVGLSSGSSSAETTNNSANNNNSGVGQMAAAEFGQQQQQTLEGHAVLGPSDQVPDKIDSSFTRSRSSSSSSTTAAGGGGGGHEQQHGNHHHHHQHQQQQQQQQQNVAESIQCLCFLDWSLATSSSSSSQGQTTTAASASSGSSLQTATAATGNQQQRETPTLSGISHHTGSNNKSLSSIECSPPGQLALWLGTSQGSVLLVSLIMPDSEDNRVLQLQSVNAEPIPQATIKLPGAILCLKPFACERHLTTSSSHQLASQTSSSLESDVTADCVTSVSGSSAQVNLGAASITTGNPATQANLRAQDSMGHHHYSLFDSRTFLAIVSEKQAKIYQVPAANQAVAATSSTNKRESSSATGSANQASTGSDYASSSSGGHHNLSGGASGLLLHQQESLAESPMAKFLINKANCISKINLSDSSYACRASLIQMRQPEESCLVCYLATGNLLVLSLPKGNQLLDTDFVPFTSARIASSMQFSRNGHCLYQPSPGEVCKFTLSAQYKTLVNEMTGLLYVPRDMPEMPRANFFKSLFAVATSSASARQSERDELFGECSAGKPSRGVAKHISSSSGLDKLKGAAVGTMGHDMRVAREGLDERGEKLGQIDDATLAMMNQSESYAQAAHQLAQKFKDKKWYQF